MGHVLGDSLSLIRNWSVFLYSLGWHIEVWRLASEFGDLYTTGVKILAIRFMVFLGS